MMIDQLGWEKIDLTRALKHLAAMQKAGTCFSTLKALFRLTLVRVCTSDKDRKVKRSI